MNPVILFIASGYLFYVGMVFFAVGLILVWFRKKRLAQAAMILGVLSIIFSATPCNWVCLILLMAPAVLLLLPWQDNRVRIGCSVICGSVILMMTGMEARYWIDPQPLSCLGKIHIVGDSISAGIGFKGEVTYAELLGGQVVNHSVGGGTVGSAYGTLDYFKCGPEDILLLEIGGNDMLKGTNGAEFRAGLEALLQKASATGAKMIMIELPLPPFYPGYALAQRELAAKYGVELIPKRHFAAVVRGSKSTADGLHLSNYGHEKMAAMLRRFILFREFEITELP